jgi:hypothetical protein
MAAPVKDCFYKPKSKYMFTINICLTLNNWCGDNKGLEIMALNHDQGRRFGGQS